MSVDNYFSIIISILMGLAFVAISLIFLYIIYGEKEETAESTSPTKAAIVTDRILLTACRIPAFA
jgi:flagellar basal body-associated protein FliL